MYMKLIITKYFFRFLVNYNKFFSIQLITKVYIPQYTSCGIIKANKSCVTNFFWIKISEN